MGRTTRAALVNNMTDVHEPSASSPAPKKRRLHGACDACKKKKVKCDSAEMPDNRCTNCCISGIQCTHTIPRQPKKKDTQQAYISRLEDRLEKMQRFLQTAFPDQDIDDIIEGSLGDDVRDASLSPGPSDSSTLGSNYLVPNSISNNISSPLPASEDTSETDDHADIALTEDLRKLSITTFQDRFFGQSSGFILARATTTAKNELTGTNSQVFGNLRRPMFWDIRPWEETLVYGDKPHYTYPEQDLLWNLVSLYFKHTNMFLPLLHRPTFEKSLAAGQHMWDPSFGMTVLLVCANASRYSDDPRVILADDPYGLSCGWKYFCQVPVYRNTLLASSTVYDLQYYCLAIIYLQGTSIPGAGWNLLGLGVRLAIERGLHRRRSFSKNSQAEEELLKRSFWCLMCIDRLAGSFLGRVCLLMDEDFDVDYPIECDDEYWKPDGGQAFQQPSGKPSVITTFVYELKLLEILAYTLRTLYATKKSKIRSGLIGNDWEQRIVAELDSSLNKWKDSLPEVLRWDPNQTDSTFFDHTVLLYSTFFYIQIQVHRPFLTKKSDLSLVSLAICTNAARSCIHLLEVALKRGLTFSPVILNSAFTSGLIIVLNVWGGRKSGLLQNAAKEMANVQICLDILKEGEKRWHVGGRLYDLLNQISSLNEQPSSDQTMQDLSSMKPGNESLPASNSLYPTITSHAINPTSLSTMPPAPISKPNGMTPGFNNFSLSQMGILPADPVVLPPSNNDAEAWYVKFNDVALQGWVPPPTRGAEYEMTGPDEFMDDPPFMYPNGTVNAEMLSLWSNASATFSGEEWDAYIANISQTLPFT